MAEQTKPRRVSKSEWLMVALDMLEHGGVDAVRVDRMAKRLRISRSGFYWHFKDREELLRQMLEYWLDEYTVIVLNSFSSSDLKKDKILIKVAEMIDEYDLNRYDLPIREWAMHDEMARTAVSEANRLRNEFIGSQFAGLGFTGDELEMRTRLFVCYHTWEKPMFYDMSKSKRAKLRKLRLDLLTRR